MQSHILVPILQEMEPFPVLRLSLVYPELFDESMWRRLVPEWDYYAHLDLSHRRRFVEICARKSKLCLSWYSTEQKVTFAILNQRKDLLEQLCRRYPKAVEAVCDRLADEGNIYFNRSMLNHACNHLGYAVTHREQAIVEFADGEISGLSDRDYAVLCILSKDDRFYQNWADRRHEKTDDAKSLFIETLLSENNKEVWFEIYSMTQEKAIIKTFISRVSETEVKSETKEIILRNLYRANHLDLVEEFVKRFHVALYHEDVLSCLADYYYNTGDDRGLYESLLYIERQHLFYPGSYHSKIFDIELEEIASLLNRNQIS